MLEILNGITRGQLARQAGVNPARITEWIELGLIESPTHMFNGLKHPRYTEDEAIEIIKWIAKRKESR